MQSKQVADPGRRDDRGRLGGRAADRGGQHAYELADTTVELGISEGQRKGQTVELRQVTRLKRPKPGRRLPKGHAVIGYGFFTLGETPHAAINRLATGWPALRFRLVPRPPD